MMLLSLSTVLQEATSPLTARRQQAITIFSMKIVTQIITSLFTFFSPVVKSINPIYVLDVNLAIHAHVILSQFSIATYIQNLL